MPVYGSVPPRACDVTPIERGGPPQVRRPSDGQRSPDRLDPLHSKYPTRPQSRLLTPKPTRKAARILAPSATLAATQTHPRARKPSPRVHACAGTLCSDRWVGAVPRSLSRRPAHAPVAQDDQTPHGVCSCLFRGGAGGACEAMVGPNVA